MVRPARLGLARASKIYQREGTLRRATSSGGESWGAGAICQVSAECVPSHGQSVIHSYCKRLFFGFDRNDGRTAKAKACSRSAPHSYMCRVANFCAKMVRRCVFATLSMFRVPEGPAREEFRRGWESGPAHHFFLLSCSRWGTGPASENDAGSGAGEDARRGTIPSS